MKHVFRNNATALALTSTLFCAPAFAAPADDMFQIRTTAKTPEMVVEEFKAFAEKKKWQFLGAQQVKMGEVTLVKVCIPEIGKQLWPLGLHLSAMLPCGNFGIYLKGGKTEISMLHAKYMNAIHPNPAIEKIAENLQPMLVEMLDAALN